MTADDRPQPNYGPRIVSDQHSPVQSGRPPRAILDAFFLPRGLLGRVGGLLMARGLPQQREIADLLTTPGIELCEVGCGPGVLGVLLAQRHPAAPAPGRPGP
jgi:hypothetical protein